MRALIGSGLLLLLATTSVAAECPGPPLDFSGTQYEDCMQDRLRGSQISAGVDQGRARPPLTPHPALTMTGQHPPGGPWVTVYEPEEFGDVTVCVDAIEGLPGGKQCGGVCALITDGSALCAKTCNQKVTGTLELGVLSLATGVTVALRPPVAVALSTYGGSRPPANCEGRADGAYHAYCQWVRTCLTVTVSPAQGLTATATAWLRGVGPKDHPSRYDPDHPTLTLMGTLRYSGARPVQVGTRGRIGILGTAIEQQRISFTNFSIGP